MSATHTQGEWKAIRWTTHAATTVVVEDATAYTGKRVIAECDTEDDAALIAAAPKMLAMLRKMLAIEMNPAISAEIDAVIRQAEVRS